MLLLIHYHIALKPINCLGKYVPFLIWNGLRESANDDGSLIIDLKVKTQIESGFKTLFIDYIKHLDSVEVP
jgi:hypothetical protein